MNGRAVWTIAQKDMRAMTANLQVWLPMLILPIFVVALPAALVGLLNLESPTVQAELHKFFALLDRLPAQALGDIFTDLPRVEQKVAYLIGNYFSAPLFLLIPLMAASVMSADSFAGEKERGTLESLLFAPVDMLSLFIGKVLASLLPAVVLSLLTFVLSCVAMNLAGWPLFGGPFFPNAVWLPLMLLVLPLISLAAVLVNVFISAKVSTFQAAYQLGGVTVLPIVALLISQATGVLLVVPSLLLAIAGGLAVIDAVLLRIALRNLDRTRLFESQVR